MRIKVRDFYMEHEDLGTRIPLLFIHGYPLNRTLWDAQVNELSDIARTLAPDLRGHGGSDPVPGPYSMDLLADDLNAFLDALPRTSARRRSPDPTPRCRSRLPYRS